MSQPRLFIGSSQKSIRAARALANGLEGCARVRVWNEGVFGLNQGFLESLLQALAEHDFAAFVLGPDDMTTSADASNPSPRDNVLFESGLFMGVLGRERVFLIHDRSVALKIPSDLAGVTLASYDGSTISGSAQDAERAMRKACDVISDQIGQSRFPHLSGEWRSRYVMSGDIGAPTVEEDVDIRVCSDVVSISVKHNPQDDYYTATGRIVMDRQISGKWRNQRDRSDEQGLFVLTVAPSAHFMYGYCTGQDATGTPIYGPWVLAKKTGSGEPQIAERLRTAEETLRRLTLGFAPQP